jgi:hypothetical protein
VALETVERAKDITRVITLAKARNFSPICLKQRQSLMDARKRNSTKFPESFETVRRGVINTTEDHPLPVTGNFTIDITDLRYISP